MEKMEGKGKVCGCMHHMVLPTLVVLIGLDFLLGALGVLTMGFVMISWPIIVIIAGIKMFVRCDCCSTM